MCNDTFYLVLHEHSCCLDEQEPERYTKAILQEQKRRDWEEFREMVQSYPVAWVDEAHVIDGLTEKIDSKLKEL